MKKLLLAAAACTMLAAPAVAADLPRQPVYKAPPPPVRVFSWTGCYIGGHVGGFLSTKEWFDHEPGASTFGQLDGIHDPNGFLGGVQGGCDYQFAGNIVIGVAGDYAWSNAKASNDSALFALWSDHTSVKSLASATARIGYALDRFLVYVKGGAAWERDEHLNLHPTDPIGSARVTRTGWTIGGGGEYAFTDYLSGFLEYNYYDFGTRDVVFTYTDGTTYTYGINDTKSVFKGGLNLRWGGGAWSR